MRSARRAMRALRVSRSGRGAWSSWIAARLEQIADDPFTLNQGTLYPALMRLEQLYPGTAELSIADFVPSRKELNMTGFNPDPAACSGVNP